ncbi:hypothetical protein ACFOEE_00950 [Pseudoalteromonas fenneropenaei]|uniref:Porin n=1 Tax=Pseudoalteromonas fenneropenaei TaxID=1737459 RepID=A0ABV7CEI7_9GAMM
MAAAEVKLDAFVNIGAFASNSEYVGVRSQVSQHDAVFAGQLDWKQLSSAGLQAEWQLSQEWQIIGQAIIKDDASHDAEDRIKLAFVRYSPTPNITLRAGRTAFDLYMMTDFRDIGYAYSTTHLPTEFYGIIPNESVDGLDISYKSNTDLGLLTTKAYFGKSTAPIISDGDFRWDFTADNIMGLVLQLEQDNWLFRANHTLTEADDGYPGQQELVGGLAQVPPNIWPMAMELKDSLQFTNTKLRYSALGLRFDNIDYVVQSEVSFVDSRSILLNNLLSAYISVSKRVAEHTFTFTHAHIQADAPEIAEPLVALPPLMVLYDAVKTATDFYRLRQDSYSLSWRYDLSDTWAVKCQYDFNKVAHQPSGLYLHDFTQPEDKTFSSFSITSNWIFEL